MFFKRSARGGGAAKDVVLLAKPSIEAGDLGAELESFLAVATERNDGDQSGENGDGAESEDCGNEPGAALGDVVVQRFDGDVGVALALDGVLEHGAKFFFGAAFAKLRANASGKFDGVKRKGENIVCAEVECTGALEGVAPDDHDNLRSGFGAGTRVELRDEAAAGEVGRRGFGDEEVGRGGENVVDGEAVFDDEFVSLTGECALHGVERTGSEVKKKNSHGYSMHRRKLRI